MAWLLDPHPGGRAWIRPNLARLQYLKSHRYLAPGAIVNFDPILVPPSETSKSNRFFQSQGRYRSMRQVKRRPIKLMSSGYRYAGLNVLEMMNLRSLKKTIAMYIALARNSEGTTRSERYYIVVSLSTKLIRNPNVGSCISTAPYLMIEIFGICFGFVESMFLVYYLSLGCVMSL